MIKPKSFATKMLKKEGTTIATVIRTGKSLKFTAIRKQCYSQMHDAGYTIKEIAEVFKKSEINVYKHLRNIKKEDILLG